jgi:flagellar basal body-associated protein FliL|tara:strand:+ start:289 stop:417 length:129 start_codon:yes stop_codon:yes gene_type:complete
MKKQKKSRKEILTDIIVLMIVICVVGGMLVYAHYDIKGIVND